MSFFELILRELLKSEMSCEFFLNFNSEDFFDLHNFLSHCAADY